MKKSQNSRNLCFSYYFCLMIEGTVSGTVSLTNGSGSGSPKNIWILWIRIRIWIRNTALFHQNYDLYWTTSRKLGFWWPCFKLQEMSCFLMFSHSAVMVHPEPA